MAPMLPSKRSRVQATGDDDEGLQIDGTESSPELPHDNARKKRARLSTALEDGDQSSDASDAPDEISSEDSENEQFMRDGDEDGDDANEEPDAEDDLRYQEQDDIRQTQIYLKQVQRSKDQINQAADNAIIEEIKCINFMCHDRLTVKVGPLINFVIGHNGSGKSAVLTALTLCLGGKATATNRGQSLKSFIKEGTDQAILSVKIKNQGPSAYQPEVYGKSIIVERHFSRSGTSGFKIKNAKERIISTKRADLEDIADAFALQLDNPMNVLTQDMARQFLNHSTPHDKYKFFVRGTQLEQLDNDYRLLEQSLDGMEAKIRTKHDDVRHLQRTYHEAEKKLQRATRHDGLRAKLNNYRHQMAWVQVEEQEKYLEQVEEEIRRADAKVAQATAEAEEASVAFDEADRQHNSAQTTLENLNSQKEPYRDEHAGLKAQFDENKDKLQQNLSQQRDIQGEIKTTESQMAKIQDDIAKERQRQEAAMGGAHARKLDEIQEAKEAVQNAHQAMVDHESNAKQIDRDKAAAEDALKKLKPVVEAKREEIRKTESLLNSLRKDDGQWMSGYDRGLGSLLGMIKEERGFRNPPVGPLGRYISLLQPEWSSILEKSSGRILNAFAVTTKHDQSILSGLIKRSGYNGEVLIVSPAPIDISGNEPDPHLTTWLRVLRFENDLARKACIIHQTVDQTVLIKSRKEAYKFMCDGPAPKNVRQTFSMHDEIRGDGHRFALGVSGPRIDPIEKFTGRPRMKTDLSARIAAEEENLAALKHEYAEIDQAYKEAQAEMRSCQDRINRHKSQSRELRLAHQQAEEHEERLRHELDVDMPQAGTIEALNDQLGVLEAELRFQQNAFGDAIAEKDRLVSANRQLKDKLDIVQRQIVEFDMKIRKAQNSLSKLDEVRKARLHEKNRAVQKVEDANQERAEQEEERQKQIETVQNWIAEASKISERVPIDRGETFESLKNKLKKLDADIKMGERDLGATREELAERCLEAKNTLDNAKIQVRNLEATASSLKMAMMNRKDRWAKFRRFISSRARITFAYLLSERKFRGNLEIDPSRKWLDIKVEPDIQQRSDKGRQTKTLSGGEKSFSTICLLLSLWDAMGSPIRCLDEFDVFMDNVNRDISMKMMIQAARKSVGRQYILITPQAMGNVNLAEDVKIIKMSDPERGQTTLPFAG